MITKKESASKLDQQQSEILARIRKEAGLERSAAGRNSKYVVYSETVRRLSSEAFARGCKTTDVASAVSTTVQTARKWRKSPSFTPFRELEILPIAPSRIAHSSDSVISDDCQKTHVGGRLEVVLQSGVKIFLDSEQLTEQMLGIFNRV